ncbi:VRR-NUC domain-containing protein [Aerococcus urinae]|uniref:VRR-NUC domain-containing protein n=1 Tax=Aerococcus urinae TaxID=1376 RepID=UPI002550CF43|nr:VRR-NUC domain-containing protein [Aerococcus urinae]MDK6688313.1 VRR-NUC domain-containing protein [Aerococcus urinae]
MQLEKDVESYLKKQVERLGGLCLKFESPGLSGVPDRLILYQGECYFVELKQKGKKPRPLQLKRHKDFKVRGFPVAVIDRKEQVDEWIDQNLS